MTSLTVDIVGGENVIKDSTAALAVGTLIGYVLSKTQQTLGFNFGMTQDDSRINAGVRGFPVTSGAVMARRSGCGR